MHVLNFVLLHVVLLSGLMNDFASGLEDQTYILCTGVSSWSDAMNTCLNKGGRPLTHDDIKMTNLSEKINLTVWTAEYTAISNQTWNSSTGRDLLRDTACGIQTIHIDKLPHGSVIEKVTEIKYKNCTEQQAYVCDKGQHMHPNVYLNKATWMNAETSCKSQNRSLLTVNQLDFGNYISVVPELLVSTKLDIWIGLLASLDFRVKTEKGPLKSDNIVTWGTFSNSAGYRMIDGYLPNQFTALCGFGNSMPVDTSLFNYCLEGHMTLETPNGNPESIEKIPWLVLAVIVSCSVLVVIISGSVAICLYKKSHTRKETNSGTGQITSLSQARVFQKRHNNTTDKVGDQSQDEKEVYSEVIPDNLHEVYVNDRDNVHNVEPALVNPESSYVNKTPEGIYEVDSDYVNEKEEGRYEALMRFKDSVYANKTPEGHYEELVKENTEIVYVNE